jgi:ArsR family transcriptional regulator
MVMKTPQALKALASLAQHTRLAIYRVLVQQGPGGLSAGTVARRLNLPAATLSFHLKELANAGMVESRQEGRFIYYAANYDRMNGLLAYLSENCCQGEACPSDGAPQARHKRKSA